MDRGTWSHAPVQNMNTWMQQQSMQQLYPSTQLTQNMYQSAQSMYGPSPAMGYNPPSLKTPIETYAPRSFATDDESPPPEPKIVIRQKKRKEKKHRDKVIVTAQVRKENEEPIRHKSRRHHKKKKKKHRRDSSSSSSTESSSSSEDTSSSSSSDSESEEDRRKSKKKKKHKKKSKKDKKKKDETVVQVTTTSQATPAEPKKVPKKGPKVNHYLEYSIVSLFFNILFGTVAIVLSGKPTLRLLSRCTSAVYNTYTNLLKSTMSCITHFEALQCSLSR